MDEIGSAAWWLSAVVVAIVVNLASAYLKSPLDSLISRLSGAWGTRSAARKADWGRDVAAVRKDVAFRQRILEGETRRRLRGITMMVIGLGFANLLAICEFMAAIAGANVPGWVPSVIAAYAALCVVFGSADSVKARELQTLVDEADGLRED